MFTTILYQPEVPPNVGNVIRLCASTGADLYLVKPLGFPLDSNKMRCTGLDYHELAKLTIHENFEDCLKTLEGRRIFALTIGGKTHLGEASFRKNDVFLFGPKTRGLPTEIPDSLPAGRRLRLPMQSGGRSVNLSSTVTVMLFEA